MSRAEEPSLRKQLVDARAKIIAQLDELNYRANAVGFARKGGPPNYRPVMAELESELRDIDALLAEGEDDA